MPTRCLPTIPLIYKKRDTYKVSPNDPPLSHAYKTCLQDAYKVSPNDPPLSLLPSPSLLPSFPPSLRPLSFLSHGHTLHDVCVDLQDAFIGKQANSQKAQHLVLRRNRPVKVF
jgi:hypothetical protein